MTDYQNIDELCLTLKKDTVQRRNQKKVTIHRILVISKKNPRY